MNVKLKFSLMRVLHVSTNFHPIKGGLETFIADLASRQRAAGIDARVLCMNRDRRGDAELPAHDEHKGIPIRRVPFWDLKFYKPTRLPIDELQQADVIHVHVLGAHLDSVARLKSKHNKPFIVSTHGGIFHTQTLATLKSLYANSIMKRSLAKASAIVASGPGDLEHISKIDPRTIRIPNGVDLQHLLAMDLSQKEPRRLLCLGRLARNKRIDRLIRFMPEVLKNDPGYRLAVVGSDFENLSGGLKSLARELKCEHAVEFVGEVSAEQLRREIARAAVVVSASEYEGFGLAVVEAMAGGCVPVLQDIPAFADILGDELSRHRVDFDDAKASAAKVHQLLNRSGGSQSSGSCLQGELATANPTASQERQPSKIDPSAMRQRAATFDWADIFPKWTSLYEQVLRNR
jgi:alpha-1,3-mannosyltransferase